jgi:hypothetical protein
MNLDQLTQSRYDRISDEFMNSLLTDENAKIRNLLRDKKRCISPNREIRYNHKLQASKPKEGQSFATFHPVTTPSALVIVKYLQQKFSLDFNF